MADDWKGHEFEALSLRYQDQVELLRTMTQVDLRVFSGFLTLQLALGAWVSRNPPGGGLPRLGFLVLDLVLTGIAGKLLYNNYRRRKEVVGTLKNLNEALGFARPGVYLQDRAINAATTFRPWWWWYLIGLLAAAFGFAVILLGDPAR
jgi:hypothetical protein